MLDLQEHGVVKTTELFYSNLNPVDRKNTPFWIQSLADAIEKAPTPLFVGRTKITKDTPQSTLTEYLRVFQYEEKERLQYFREKIHANSDLGITANGKSVELSPVNLLEVLKSRLLTSTLVHDGFMVINGMDNVRQIKEKGVFGNIDINQPVYMKTLGAEILPNALTEAEKKELIPVRLYLDAKKISEFRTVFADPESFRIELPEEKPGQSYLILGGIPVSAIVGISDKTDFTYLPT